MKILMMKKLNKSLMKTKLKKYTFNYKLKYINYNFLIDLKIIDFPKKANYFPSKNIILFFHNKLY